MRFERDQRIAVVPHPRIGQTAIAARTIQRSDEFLFWGALHSLPCVDGEPCAENEFQVTTGDGRYIVDPTKYAADSLCMYINAPGPGEVPCLRATGVDVLSEDRLLGGVVLKATRSIPKGYQMTWNYGGVVTFFKGWNRARIPIEAPGLPTFKALRPEQQPVRKSLRILGRVPPSTP